ncbi:acyltransferase [Methanobrevibacter sp.]|uniref:acyltransferase n=1 Tax=Methanobrevibacter sp. TaxID=66852 RepID=UPI0025E4F3EC|nr:acyltransferase [Methanobrevibacter sp.]MBQ2666515.1 acyltransferase [Methanobrevibacter sp.]
MTISKSKRIFYYDFLRTIAILAVILCHVDGMIGYGFNNLKNAIPGFLTIISVTGVPIFLMLTGALLLNKNYSLIDFYKRRFRRIIPPFIFWMAITIIFGVIFLNWSNVDVFNEFFGITSHTWYIWTLIPIYILLPLINEYIKRFKFKGIELLLIIWLIAIIFDVFTHIPIWFVLSNLLGFMGFVILGYYLDNKKFSISNKKMLLFGILIFTLFTLMHMFVMYNEINVYTDIYLNILTIFQSCGVFLIVKNLDILSKNNLYTKIRSNYIGKIVISISILSYGMYFAHYILIKYFETLNIHSIKLLPAIFILIAGLSWLVNLVLSKIPFVKSISI